MVRKRCWERRRIRRRNKRMSARGRGGERGEIKKVHVIRR